MRSMYSPISHPPHLASYLNDWDFPPFNGAISMPGKRQKTSVDTYQERRSLEHDESSETSSILTPRSQPLHLHPRHPHQHERRISASLPDVNPPGSTQSSTRPSSTLTATGASTSWPSRDDNILIRARSQGHGWSQIQKQHFPGKTPNACRKRYERLVAKRRGSDWGIDKLEKLGVEYRLVREQMWKPLADAMGERWDHVEKACFERGIKSLLSQGRVSRGSESRNNSIHEETPVIERGPQPPVTTTASPPGRILTLHELLAD